MLKVGDLVSSVNGWYGWLFVVTDIRDDGAVRCTIVKSPHPDKGYGVGHELRWLPKNQWEKIN